MTSIKKIRSRFKPLFTFSAQYFFGMVLFFLLCPGFSTAQNAPETVTIKLPDGSDMYFKAVYLGIDGNSLFASRRIKLGSREPNPSYKERLVETLLSGAFVGKRDGKPDWLYYLGETEVQRGQWNSVMDWMDQQEGRNSTVTEQDKKHSDLPRTEVTIAEIYRFTEALNSWMLRKQSSQLPKFGNARAFCRLPTEAEWAFAARGGIEVDRVVFDRPYPYSEELGEYEWHRGNTNSNIQECGSKHLQPNPIGLKDMLGNAEELTVSLFSPEYQQGRFGHLVIRGNNYSDSPENFSVAHRTEFTSHNQEGKLRRSSKVGFRLALSTPITSAGKQSSDLDKEFDQYFSSRGLTVSGPVGISSPAAQAKEDNIHYLEEQLERIKADKEKLNAEISHLKTLRNNDQKKHSETKYANKELDNTIKRLETAQAEIRRLKEELRISAQKADKARPSSDTAVGLEKSSRDKNKIKELERRLAATPDSKKLEKAEQRVAQLKDKNEALAAKLKDLEMSESKLVDLSQELKRKEQEVADLGRRQQLYEHEVTKNAGRVREVEKRYLEALMRQASANAYIGWRILKKREVYLRRTGRNASDEKAQEALAEASQMINDYWHLVIQMAEETQADLFPQVKQELSSWLQQRESKGGDSRQRNALNLIERHLTAVRAGKRLRPDDLISSFLTQPEFL